MAILNRPSDGLFNVLITIYKILAFNPSLSRDEIVTICAPGGTQNNQVRQTLTRWTQLGLFLEDQGEYKIIKSFKPSGKRTMDEAISGLPFALRQLVFAEENNKNFWNSEKSLSADFTRGVAWLLAQDVYNMPTTNHADVQSIENVQIKDNKKRILQNNVRWSGLKEWANYLGFGWNGKSFIIDPTIAIRESLPYVFEKDSMITAKVFIDKLGNILPVIDSGKYRQKVEATLDSQSWKQTPEFHISTSLSRAIKRLEVSKCVRLEYRSDTGQVYRLVGQDSTEWGNFTHVTWVGDKK